tara:strand:+ start:181 stop:1161 length:981 start_codon:yes stop_codon:yes gene_type:complete
MAFLDNSGDIILDAVLTDTGRFRLAKGDGSFKIVKFALGDDEINYATYDKNNLSGSAYYDLEILQTPILEAFTNNTSLMNSKLISIPRTNLLYLPVLKLSGDPDNNGTTGGGFNSNFEVCVNLETVGDTSNFEGLIINKVTSADSAPVVAGNTQGRLDGFNTANWKNCIRVDQGLDTNEISDKYSIDADLLETQYIIEIDNRFGSIASSANGTLANVSFIDDDNIASYYLSKGTDPTFIFDIGQDTAASQVSRIAGPRGTMLKFKIQASTDLATSDYLFTQLGSQTTATTADGKTMDIYFIDSIVKVTGATTGYRIDIPVRFVKKR